MITDIAERSVTVNTVLEQERKLNIELLESYFETVINRMGNGDSDMEDDDLFAKKQMHHGGKHHRAGVNASLMMITTNKDTHQKILWEKWTGNCDIPDYMDKFVAPYIGSGSLGPPLSIAFKSQIWQQIGATSRARVSASADKIRQEAILQRSGGFKSDKRGGRGVSSASSESKLDDISFHDLMRSVPVFHPLDEEELALVENQCDNLHFSDQDLILIQGQRAAKIFLIKDGCVSVNQTATTGIREITHTLSRGDYFGDSALTDKTSGSTFISSGSSVLVAIPPEVLRLAIEKDTLSSGGAARAIGGRNVFLDWHADSHVPDREELSLATHVEQFLEFLLIFPGDVDDSRPIATPKPAVGASGARRGKRPSLHVFAAPETASSSTSGSFALEAETDHSAANDKAKKTLMLEMLSSNCPELDFDETLSSMTALAQQFFGVDRVGLFIIDKLKNTMVLKMSQAVEGAAGIEVPLKGIAGYIARKGTILNMPDSYSSDLFDSSMDIKTGYRTKQMLCIPCFDKQGSSGNVVGVLQCINTGFVVVYRIFLV